MLYISGKCDKINYICVIFREARCGRAQKQYSSRKACTADSDVGKWQRYRNCSAAESDMEVNMEQRTEDRQQMVREYREMLEPLLRYLPWMEGNAGKAASRSYQG